MFLTNLFNFDFDFSSQDLNFAFFLTPKIEMIQAYKTWVVVDPGLVKNSKNLMEYNVCSNFRLYTGH